MNGAGVGDAERRLTAARTHDAWNGRYCGGQPGFSEPELRLANTYPLDPEHADGLRDRGISIIGHAGAECFVCIADPASRFDLRINLHGYHRTAIFLGPTKALHGQINVEGDDHLFIFAGSPGHNRINATFRSHGGAMLIGSGATSNDIDLLAEGKSIQIGDDALISYGVHVLTSDSHGVIDLRATPPRQTNFPQSIFIGPHVWLSANCIVQKGVTIGPGAIIATGAVVARDVASDSLAGGLPARIIRENVTWTREVLPDEAAIARAIRAAHPPARQEAALRLIAPANDAPEWHGVETLGAIGWRWSRSERLTWRIPPPGALPRTLRIEIPFVNEIEPGFAAASVLETDGLTYPMRVEEQTLTAMVTLDEKYDGTLHLVTPAPRQPPGGDRRFLGVAVSTS